MISYYRLSVVGKSDKTGDVPLSVLIISKRFKNLLMKCPQYVVNSRQEQPGLPFKVCFIESFCLVGQKNLFSPLVVKVTQVLIFHSFSLKHTVRQWSERSWLRSYTKEKKISPPHWRPQQEKKLDQTEKPKCPLGGRPCWYYGIEKTLSSLHAAASWSLPTNQRDKCSPNPCSPGAPWLVISCRYEMSGGFVWAIIYLYVYSLSCFNPKSAISREPSRVFERLWKERQAYPSLCLPREEGDFLVSFFSPLSTQWRQFSVSGVGRKFWNLIANIFKERAESNKLFKNHQVWKWVASPVKMSGRLCIL